MLNQGAGWTEHIISAGRNVHQHDRRRDAVSSSRPV